MNALISAYACEPGKGSEPEVGWRGSKAISDGHNVTVFTRANNRSSIEAVECGSDTRAFRYFDLPRGLLRVKRMFGLTLGYYCVWHVLAAVSLRRSLSRFDVLHHLTFNAFQFPGFWLFSKPAVVLGPLGGGQICPLKLLPFFRSHAVKEFFRSLTVLLSGFNPMLLLCFYFAKVILVANRDTENRLPWYARMKARRLLETAIDVSVEHPLPEPPSHQIRFLLLGRLEKRKGGELALRALANALRRNAAILLTIAGTGPDERFLRQLSSRLNIDKNVHFAGRVERKSLPTLFASHHALVFPSLRDTSGNVVLEAMSYGRPVIALRHQGVAEIANDNTAILLEPGNVKQTICRFSDAMLLLAADPAMRVTLGACGLQRVRSKFSWERYAEAVSDAYKVALSMEEHTR